MNETKEVQSNELDEVRQITSRMDIFPRRIPSSVGRNNRMAQRVWNHLEENRRTMEEEYNLILAKESKMSRSMRDYLQGVMEYEPTEVDIAMAKARKQRIEAMQEEE